MKQHKKGFTLVELLVVVLIIGVLAAIALPMYQKAVMKSRFSALMPIAKALNEGNEHYYLNHSVYSTDPAELDIAGKDEYDDDTEVFLVNEDGFSYVMAYNEDRLPDNKYIAFQKHSERFADTTMCEAADEAAGQICESFGGTSLGGGITNGWMAYLLSGSAAGSSFCPAGATCNSQGEITECPSGKTLKEGSCVACDIANAASCSTTSYAATSCASGYCMKNGACAVCDYSGNNGCGAFDHCEHSTFGGNARCGANGFCAYSSFNDQSTCNGTDAYPNYATCDASTFSGESSCGQNAHCSSGVYTGITTFTDDTTCSGQCYGAAFSGNASCVDGICERSNGGTPAPTFTDNASCVGNARCSGSVFSGNSVCTSSWMNGSVGAGCSQNGNASRSTFTGNAVCAGTGCNTANYEGNACCAGSSCPSGVRKCVYNSDTKTYDPAGYWE